MSKNLNNMRRESNASDSELSERDSLVGEVVWLQRNATEYFRRVEEILHKCLDRFHVSNKFYTSTKPGSSPAKSERYSLVQRNGADTLKVSVLLLGENVIQTEVAMKYPKISGGIFRATAQPEVQWKLQQLQDAGNYCVEALRTVAKGNEFIQYMAKRKSWNLECGEPLCMIVESICSLIGKARSTLCIPRKRSLLELCNFQPTRCFNPSLPSDLVFSYYISSSRLICAAYHMTGKANGNQGLVVTQAECTLPSLVEILVLLQQALNTVQRLRHQLIMFHSHLPNLHGNNDVPTRS
ncbi:hypothetical protein AB6A40_007498 [Gnathostoma spinigerum]|uniref:Uncharacterized protein n=1 Tax=Gnathostoma spinigerum TaxID=75299 RepID=A0ABD6ELE7_9BILA